MKRKLVVTLGLAVAVFGGSAVAFEEQKMQPKASLGQSQASTAAGPQAPLTSGVQVPKIDSGTKVRVPGLGVIGEIPKMDFGLELLYGASQPKQSFDETQASGVMGRVTVPLKTPR